MSETLGFEEEQGYFIPHISDEPSQYKETSAEVNIWTAEGAYSELSLAKITPSDSKQGSGSLFLLELRILLVTFVHGGLTQKGLK